MLREKEDAYGREVLAFLEQGKGFEIVERDDGYIDVSSGPAAYFSEFSAWPLHMQQAMGLVRGRVLDIGCGAGRVSLHLQERGHDVAAIDVSPLAVEVSRRRGVRDARVLSITEITPALGVFDTIVMMGNNFGLFGGFARARWLLRRFKRLTSPGARIIAETNDPYQTTDPLHLAYHERNRRLGRMGGQLHLRVRWRDYASPWFDYLLASRDEVQRITAGTGWRLAETVDTPGSIYVAVLAKDAA
jgi:SAM-dependent methyltransferase